MFDKILIANRGEIACRIIRTASRLGIKTVAVYSDADRRALHVEMADEAVAIGPAAAAASYLVGDAIVDACRQTGAEAVHPGYGFLSENAAFARMLKDANIIFVGPNAAAIEVMGDKIASKKAARDAGVNTVPGHIGLIEDEAHAIQIADQIGYPVMIKASAGGGGKGMRIAHNADQVAEGFRLARSEALSSFADDRIFIEKYITDPRHIEIQVLGDSHGHIIHLGERECSIQRRNQKVIEEAPSPLLDDKTRALMGEQAVALARAVSYDSAGTVEFVVDQDKRFYFLEMNTRLQVEHPVTEMITRVDLVEQMLRVASGEKLPLTQDDVRVRGWAIEARVYAEDPLRGFLPATGRIRGLKLPGKPNQASIPSDANASVRIDTGVVEGSEISLYYDPMIAKLVTHGPDRARAIAAMANALDGFSVDGVVNNLGFLSTIMDNGRWRDGHLSTHFIDEEFGETFAGRDLTQAEHAQLVGVALSLNIRQRAQLNQLSDRLRPHAGDYSGDWAVRFDDAWVEVNVKAVECSGHGRACSLRYSWAAREEPGEPGEYHVHMHDFDNGLWRGTIADADKPVEADGPKPRSHKARALCVQVRPQINGWSLHWRGAVRDVRIVRPRVAALNALMPVTQAPDMSAMVLCPMPGTVVSIAVSENQSVKVGDELCVVEAMKMENVLRAERDARIVRINAAPGDSLAVDAVIMELE